MYRIYKRFSITFGFSLLLILLIANAIVTRRQLGVQTDDQTWAAHTEQVLFQLSQTQSLMANAETGQRGYIYTGDPNYLQPYDLAATQLEPNIQRLSQLTADSPEEHARFATLRTLAQKKMSMLSKTILLYQSGYPDVAKELVVSERGRLLMATISKLIAEMAREETSLQAARSAIYKRSIGRTIASIYLATGIVALGLIFLAYYILQQIDLRDRHAQQILEREEWFCSTLTSLGEAVIATDKGGRVTFLNSTAERLTGIKLSQVKGQPVEAVFPIFNEFTHQRVENPVKKVVEPGQPIDSTNDTVLQRSDGHLIPIIGNATLILDKRNKLVGAVHVFRDATDERRSYELLRKSEKLAASAQLASASHEIGTPLGAVGDLIYIVKLIEKVPTDASELLTLAEQQLERVTHITRQMLGFYRESTLPQPVDLSALVESVLEVLSHKFLEKNITIERDLRKCPLVNGLSGDLNQAVANLVSSAVDAAPFGGTIRVELSCLDSAGGNAVMISIQCNGPGIALENIDRISEPFFTTKKNVGYGLGLWITKGIVERHGGSIQMHVDNATTSPGTVFNVLLPIDTGPQPLALEARLSGSQVSRYIV
jgi:PAS domain S-box-containing protein